MERDQSWREYASCKGKIEMFYPGKNGSSEAAKSICRECVVQESCLEYALEYEPHGVWGGKSERERRRLSKTISLNDNPVSL